MKNIIKGSNGTFTIVLHLKDDERKNLKRLAKTMHMNDFETIKYAIKLVNWWSKNRIEPEDKE